MIKIMKLYITGFFNAVILICLPLSSEREFLLKQEEKI